MEEAAAPAKSWPVAQNAAWMWSSGFGLRGQESRVLSEECGDPNVDPPKHNPCSWDP